MSPYGESERIEEWRKEMGSYPVRYRGRGRSPQRGPATNAPEFPLNPGPYFAIGAMAWAFGHLANEIAGWSPWSTSQQLPGSYGWTLTLDCGNPQQRLPAAAFTVCSASQVVVSTSAYDSNAKGSQNPLTATQLNYYTQAHGKTSPFTGYYVYRSAKWSRGTGLPFSNVTTWRPTQGLLGGPLARYWRNAAGFVEAGYGVPYVPSVPYHPPGTDILDDSWTIYFPGIPGVAPRPIPDGRPIPRPVARAVPVTGMREVKFNANTAAGRAFFAMYATFNLLGDALGFTRALWFSLPGEARGGSMKFRNMASDIWKNHSAIDPLLALRNVAQWKFLDTLYGGTQAAMFQAIAGGYGHTAARLWSTLESEINATTSFSRRRLERRQQSDSGG